jgi:LmbE family N-acetylglucosaminyl deacetylase
MKLNKTTADFFVPDGMDASAALARTTHLGIGTHQDDVEFMAVQGVLECFNPDTRPFGCITCTNGAGSARTGTYANVSNEEMCRIRRAEQRAAGVIGRYSFVAQLDYASSEVKKVGSPELVADLVAILQDTKPQVVYTHNLADKHETHVAVAVATLLAVRSLPKAKRPAKLYGCEVWRDLDWMPDDSKAVFDVSAHQNLQAAFNGVYDSQIAGGKRYDLAAMGRRRSNATFFESHAADKTELAAFAMDLTPLIVDDTLDPIGYVIDFIRRFEADVRSKLAARLPGRTTADGRAG